MKELHWKSLVQSLISGTCVLVLGPDVPATPQDSSVKGKISVRDAFCQYLIEQLESEAVEAHERVMFAVAQQFEDAPALTNLKNVAADFFERAPFEPGPVHIELAKSPFNLILTTCHDDLFAKAIRLEKKSPTQYWYNYRGETRENKEIKGILSHLSPTIYHLYGFFENPSSLVLSENDLLDFMAAVISDRPKLPDSLRNALRNKTFLFVGFGIQYWYIRVVLKLLIRAIGIPRGSFALESLAELEAEERNRTVLFYSRGTRLEVLDTDALAFAKELSDRVIKAGGVRGAATPQSKPIQIFISYERADSEIAKSLHEALPRNRFEPWLDVDFLRGGERLESATRRSEFMKAITSLS